MQTDLPAASAGVEIAAREGTSWSNAERPTPSEIAYLGQLCELDPDDLDDCLNRSLPPAITTRSSYVRVTLPVPIPFRQGRIPAPAPLALFIGRDFFVTIHTGEIRPLIRAFREWQTDNTLAAAASSDLPVDPAALARALVDRIVQWILPLRNRFAREIEEQDEALFSSDGRSSLRALLHLRRDLRAFRRSIAPWPVIFRQVADASGATGAELDHWALPIARIARLIETLDEDLVTLDGLIAASGAFTAQRSSELLRLTVVIIGLTLPLLVITGLFAMQLRSPLANQTEGFQIVLAIVGAVFLAVLYVLRSRRVL